MKLRNFLNATYFRGLMPLLMGTFLAVTLGVILVTSLLVNHVTNRFVLDQAEEHLHRASSLLLHTLEPQDFGSPGQLQGRIAQVVSGTDLRVTIISHDGDVQADSASDPSAMENHSSRPEVEAALQGSVGRSVRYSTTLGMDMLYLAFPLGISGDGILRTSIPIRSVRESLHPMRSVLVWLAVGTLAAAALFAYIFTRRVVRPLKEMTFFARQIARGQFEPRIKVAARGEIGQLAIAFNNMAGRLEQTLTELSEQRTHLQAVVGSMAEGVIVVDANGELVLINPAGQQMLGLLDADVIGRPLKEVLHIGSLITAMEDTLQTQEGNLVELELDQPTHRIVRAHTAVLQGQDPRTGGALSLIYDITELRHLERVRTDFVANVSHELRTPLTSIHGFTETLLDGADEDPQTRRRFLQIINRESERVTAIINDLLDLSRLESDKLSVTWSSVALRRLVVDTLPLVAEVADHKRIALEVNVDPGIRVRADEALLRQVFINLLDNAVKYTPDGGGRVTVDARVQGNFIRVSLSDTGIGIPRTDLPRIFERFYRVDRARSRQLGGTGLGLSIVRHIIERLGGSIHAESELGKGTTMIFTLRKAE